MDSGSHSLAKPVEEPKKIAVIGGTFDPIHMGHLAVAEIVRQELSVDMVFFVPASSPPHKEQGRVSPAKCRYEMGVLATASNPHFFVSALEMERDGTSYTVDTIRELKKMYAQDTRLLFITGADALLDIFSWEQPEALLKMCEFVAVTRPKILQAELLKHIRVLVDEYGATIHFTEVPGLEVSSSDIRCRVMVGKSIRYLVPEAVEAYIFKNGLYSFGKLARGMPAHTGLKTEGDIAALKLRLQRELTPDRYEHTLGVAETAVRLAQAFGEDTDLAFLVGLLHDIAKEWDNEAILVMCEGAQIGLDDVLMGEPNLLHGHVGAVIAMGEYGVESPKALAAIRNHTIGRPEMSVFEKLLFVADIIEPSRTKPSRWLKPEVVDCIEHIRLLACSQGRIDTAVYKALCLKRDYTLSKAGIVHPLASAALEYYRDIADKNL